MTKRYLLFALLVISFRAPFANLADSFGYSGAGIGMSGARTALADDWTSAYYNLAGFAAPALRKPLNSKPPVTSLELENTSTQNSLGLKLPAKVETESQFGLAYVYQAPVMSIESKSSSKKVKNNMEQATNDLNYGIVQLGFGFDLRNLVDVPHNIPVKLGASLAFADNGSLGALTDTTVKSYNFQRLGREAKRMVILTGLAAQVWRDRLSIGVGTNVLVGGGGTIQLTNLILDPSGAGQVPDHEIKLDLSFKLSPTGGIMYRQPIKRKHAISVGLAFRGETQLEINPIDASGKTQLLDVEVPITMALLDFYTPNIVTAGVAFAWHRKHIISIEGEFQQWSGFEINSARARIESFEKFNDVFVPKLGLEYQPLGPLVTRAGYSYVTAFTPAQSRASNFLDNDKHIISLGAGYLLPRSFRLKVPTQIDFGIQMQMWNKRTNNKSGSDPLNPSYSHEGVILIASLSFGWRF